MQLDFPRKCSLDEFREFSEFQSHMNMDFIVLESAPKCLSDFLFISSENDHISLEYPADSSHELLIQLHNLGQSMPIFCCWCQLVNLYVSTSVPLIPSFCTTLRVNSEFCNHWSACVKTMRNSVRTYLAFIRMRPGVSARRLQCNGLILSTP